MATAIVAVSHMTEIVTDVEVVTNTPTHRVNAHTLLNTLHHPLE